MFCIKCGGPAVAGNFCEKCFLDREHLFEVENFTSSFCPDCKRYEPEIKRGIMQSIKTNNKIKNCSISEKHVGNRIYAKITCIGTINPLKKPVRQEKTILITVHKRKCENCIKISGGYYEAVLQVRGKNKERILRKIEKFVKKGDVANIIHLKEGMDIRLVNKNSASKLIKIFRDYFDVKESYKLVGEKKGKKLHRNYYAIR